MRYTVRFVHKISPSEKDTREVDLPAGVPGAAVDVARELRKARVLGTGERLQSIRREDLGKIVAFPMASIWHSIILTPKKTARELDEEIENNIRHFGGRG